MCIVDFVLFMSVCSKLSALLNTMFDKYTTIKTIYFMHASIPLTSEHLFHTEDSETFLNGQWMVSDLCAACMMVLSALFYGSVVMKSKGSSESISEWVKFFFPLLRVHQSLLNKSTNIRFLHIHSLWKRRVFITLHTAKDSFTSHLKNPGEVNKSIKRFSLKLI